MKFVDLANVTAAITAAGATVPDDIAAVVAHARELSRTPDAADPAAVEAAALVPLIGDRAAFNKALTKAATNAATATAERAIRKQLGAHAARAAMTAIKARRNEIGALVAEAIAGHAAALNEHAPHVPANLDPHDPSGLSSTAYAAFRACQAAAGPLEVAARDLASLYTGAKRGGMVTDQVARRLVFVDLPQRFDDLAHAVRVAGAIAGYGRGGLLSNPNEIPARYYPATAAAAGLTFRWATPDEHAQRAARLLEAITPSTWPAESTELTRASLAV